MTITKNRKARESAVSTPSRSSSIPSKKSISPPPRKPGNGIEKSNSVWVSPAVQSPWIGPLTMRFGRSSVR
ncbi:hypothetical protein [Jiella pelagia]|uniref:Uncharacterized protein n=1 Tax=Jiella pelagia TaxID=2986949 RepID=A0ABY7CA66_9HYPH|nr:hypothetical protein [Jiella pelagia]WAP70685.1 hypothetical protein OH818_12100 [Jiella pelagia]